MNLLVTGAWRHTAAQLETLRRMGHTVIEMKDERGPLPCSYEAVEGVIGNALFLHHPIQQFTALRYIQLTSAGLDRVPVEYIREQSIALHNARGVYSTPMAEFAVGAVLDVYKQSRFFFENQKQHKWDKHRGLRELSGKTVCIVGCGHVGTACAKRFGAFGCRVVGVDLCPCTDDYFTAVYPATALVSAISGADVVVLTVPLTEQTRHMIGARELDALREGGVLVNIARGAVVDTAALIAALSKRALVAVLDVWAEEPLPADSPLWDMDNVILTPHNSFVGDGNEQRLWAIIRENLEK